MPLTISNDERLVVGLGELLWDFLPGGRQLGGAPANFAYCASLLGNESVVASRIGADDLGRQAISKLKSLGVSSNKVQQDSIHPTGTVTIEVDKRGQPHYEIVETVAWDFLEPTPAWEELARRADAVCFGSLAQRSRQSRATIQQFLRKMKSGAVRVFDVNLRQSYYSKEIIFDSLALCDIVKLNHEEVSIVAGMLGIGPEQDYRKIAEKLRETYETEMVCITRGAGGSFLLTRSELSEHPGFKVQVADTVGAGDAFTAGLVHEYLRGSQLEQMNDTANRMGAWVSSHEGAMPKKTDRWPEILAGFELNQV